MTHTPGPWFYSRNGNPIYITGNWDKVAGTYADVAEIAQQEQSEAQANARLIAAAPDILDALHHCYNIVSTGILHQSSLSKDGIIELLKDAQESAHIALTKAKGE